jgi:hypothetical protein
LSVEKIGSKRIYAFITWYKQVVYTVTYISGSGAYVVFARIACEVKMEREREKGYNFHAKTSQRDHATELKFNLSQNSPRVYRA